MQQSCFFQRARGADTNKTNVAENDILGSVDFEGYGAGTFQLGAQIKAELDAEIATGGDTTDMPTRLVFSTTDDGEGTPSECMRIDREGDVGIGTTNPTEKLDVNGGVGIQQGDLTMTNTGNDASAQNLIFKRVETR